MNKIPIEFKSIGKINTIFILAFIIDKCNYNCNYCYNKFPRDNSIMNLDKLLNFIKFIHDKTNKNIDIELIGGEPTLHPNLITFCKNIYNIDYIHCSIYTNFSADIKTYINLLQFNINLTLSYHYKNKNFISKLDMISKKLLENKVDIRVMFEIDNYDNVNKLCKTLIDKKYLDYFEPALIEYKNKTYSNKYIEFYNEINDYVTKKYVYDVQYNDGTNDLLTVNDAEQNFKNFKYWKCNAGLEYFYIHSNGNIYSCINEYIYNRCPKYNIEFDDFDKFQFKSMICIDDICPCVWEVYKKKVLNI